jgi:deoxyribonuclease (pyrimidine dimer)
MRINVVPVDSLSDVHLRAEYREILMAPHYYLRSKKSKNGIDYKSIPDTYTLNKGHAKFFYNKFGYIARRHSELEQEMISRGYKIREENRLEPMLDKIPFVMMNDYKPTYADYVINIGRILTRIKKMYNAGKGNFYKMRGQLRTYKDWEDHYDLVIRNKRKNL